MAISADSIVDHIEVASHPQNPVEVLRERVGDILLTPTKYLPENSLPNTEYHKDPKTGLAVFDGPARLHLIKELDEAVKKGGGFGVMLIDCDNLKEANDKVSRDFGTAVIIWGSSSPLYELDSLALACRTVAVRPEGSPDETIVFFINPTSEDKTKINELNRKLNNPDHRLDLSVKNNQGQDHIHPLSVTSGVAFSESDEQEATRRRHKVDIDYSPVLTSTADDIDEEIRQLKQNNPEEYKFKLVEGLRQVADDRAHEAKGIKQLELVRTFLETTRHLSLADFDRAIEQRLGGSRISTVVLQLINDSRRERYLPST